MRAVLGANALARAPFRTDFPAERVAPRGEPTVDLNKKIPALGQSDGYLSDFPGAKIALSGLPKEGTTWNRRLPRYSPQRRAVKGQQPMPYFPRFTLSCTGWRNGNWPAEAPHPA